MTWLSALAGFYSEHSFAFEVGIDIAILFLAARASKRSPAYRWVFWSFLLTLFSVVNFQILGSVFGISIQGAMGTWKELLINIPYIGFFAFGAATLIATTAKPRVSLLLSTVATLLIIGALIQGLGETGNPLQNRIIHLICFTCTGTLFGFGLVQLFSSRATGTLRFLSVGYIGVALAGLLFQITEIYPELAALGHWSDVSWTLGQLAVLFGLLIYKAPAWGAAR